MLGCNFGCIFFIIFFSLNVIFNHMGTKGDRFYLIKHQGFKRHHRVQIALHWLLPQTYWLGKVTPGPESAVLHIGSGSLPGKRDQRMDVVCGSDWLAAQQLSSDSRQSASQIYTHSHLKLKGVCVNHSNSQI